MKNRYEKTIEKILLDEIRKAEKMIAYTTEFEDKTAVGRWKMAAFQLKSLYKKIGIAFELIQNGASDEKIEKMLGVLDKHLFMEGP